MDPAIEVHLLIALSVAIYFEKLPHLEQTILQID